MSLAVFAPVSLAEQREGCAEVPRCRLTPAHTAVHPQLHERSLTSSVREINLYFYPLYYHFNSVFVCASGAVDESWDGQCVSPWWQQVRTACVQSESSAAALLAALVAHRVAKNAITRLAESKVCVCLCVCVCVCVCVFLYLYL